MTVNQGAMARTLVVILEGGPSHPTAPAHSRLGRMWADIERSRQAVTLDTIERLQETGACEVLLCTNRTPLANEAERLGITVRPTGPTFHFLKELHAIVREVPSHQLVVMGGCALPLVTVSELREWLHAIASDGEDGTVWAHGFLSPDMVGWRPSEAILSVTDCDIDNALGAALRDQVGMLIRRWERTESWQCDIDTPVDVLLLQHHRLAGRRLRDLEVFSGHRVPLPALRALMASQVYADVALMGRISPKIVQLINETCRVRVRTYSEERGMKGLGRDVQGMAVSIFTPMIELCGWTGFFETLRSVCSGAFVDTRVLMSGSMRGIRASDRFLSDLGWYEEMQHPEGRAMTKAALHAGIPIALGGHTLVSGGLRAFLESL